MGKRETFSTKAPECPYCGHVHRHDDGAFYDESQTEYECEACAKTFDMRVYTSTSWACTAREDQSHD